MPTVVDLNSYIKFFCCCKLQLFFGDDDNDDGMNA